MDAGEAPVLVKAAEKLCAILLWRSKEGPPRVVPARDLVTEQTDQGGEEVELVRVSLDAFAVLKASRLVDDQGYLEPPW